MAQHWLVGLGSEVGTDEQHFEDGGSQQEFVELPDGSTLAIGGYTHLGSEDGHARESPLPNSVQQVGSSRCQERRDSDARESPPSKFDSHIA
jgi:hypothetical protein